MQTTISQSVPNKLLSYAEMFLGISLTAMAFAWFILPRGFVAGGVTGLAVFLQQLIPIKLSVLVLLLNLSLLTLGFLCIGKEFLIKTITVSILFPFFLEYFTRLQPGYLPTDPVVNVFLSGLILGTGAGLIIRSGASAGGFDVLAIVLHRKWGMSIATIMNLCDAMVILSQSFGQPILQTVYGIIVITVSASFVRWVVSFRLPENPILQKNQLA